MPPAEVAGDPDATRHFYAPDAATLNAVYEEVANRLSELRLSKQARPGLRQDDPICWQCLDVAGGGAHTRSEIV